MNLSEVKKGDRLMVLDSWNGTPVTTAIVEKVTKKRIILEGGNAFVVETGHCYGKTPISWNYVAIITPELEEILAKVLEKQACDTKKSMAKSMAKSRLYNLIAYMQTSYFGRLSDDQLFQCVAALEAILLEVK